MTGQLQLAGGGGDEAKCVTCGAKAVGPCARCHAPVCGNCCELTEGGAKTWALCLTCARSGAGSLSRGWWQVVLWIAGPIVLLALLVFLLEILAR